MTTALQPVRPRLRAVPTAESSRNLPAMITMFREGDVESAVLDLLQAQQAKLRTMYLLQRKIDSLRAEKAQATKELGRAVKSAWEALGQQCAAEVWTPVADALGRLDDGKPTEEDLKIVSTWAAEMRRKFLRHDAAVDAKGVKLKAIKGRIEDAEIALRKVILDGGERPKQASPQMTIPDVEQVAPPAPSGWYSDKRARRVVVDVIAEEVSSTRAAAEESAADDTARASLLAQAEADEALAAALRAMGIDDEPEAVDEDDLEDEDVAEDMSDEEGEADEEMKAAEQHEALRPPPKKQRGRGKGRAKS